ncbi:MAG: amidohydrolase family protein [Labilithrix sp.]|nr:amidohydrolase family protein [Labilithrix sp.]
MTLPSRFTSLLDLTRLPWFSLSEEGRLVMNDASVGPIADLHTHLALAYIAPPSVDVHRLHAETQHYLPSCCAIDLEVYANRNMSPEIVAELTRDLTWRSLGPRGMRATHTIPNLVREMDETGIRASVLLPIDFPVLSRNADVALAAARDTSDKLFSFGSVHPYAKGAEKRLDAQLSKGARGIKMHPSVQLVRADNRRARALYRMCGERRMIVFWHCGPAGIEPKLGQYLNQVRFYEQPIAENPRTTFVLGHAGALQFDEALELQRRYPNVWLETSSQSLRNVRRLVEESDTTRVVHGSDWPFYHPAISVSKILIATEGKPEIRHAILWANASRLLDVGD